VSNTGFIVDKLAELRNAFDQTFAVSPSIKTVEQIENLLSIRMHGNLYALRATEISAFARIPKIVSVPSPFPEVLGLAGIRGGVVPVYSLAAFFGGGCEEGPRWCAWCGSEEPIGFAFGEFEGYVRASQSQIFAQAQEDVTCEHAKSVLQIDEMIRPIVSLPSIVQLLSQRCTKNIGQGKQVN
jgi:chemotaxis signal transduction protein